MTKAERRLLLILAACPTGAALDTLVRLKTSRPGLAAETRCARARLDARSLHGASVWARGHELCDQAGWIAGLGLPVPEEAENVVASLATCVPPKA
jgi:hypothetical protein